MMRDTLQDRGGAGKSWLVRGAEPGGLLRLSGGHWGSRAFVEMAGTEELQEASSVDLVRPNKKDQVKVVQFILDEQAMYVGRTGTLIAMDASNEGIIKLDTGEVIVMDMSCIGKLGSQ
uniref:Spt5 KOW domain-containing protein n=1 Tax=Dunaliella tertiolecta TaxID=3047 RepID=A0A7S3VJF5_DUNTE